MELPSESAPVSKNSKKFKKILTVAFFDSLSFYFKISHLLVHTITSSGEIVAAQHRIHVRAELLNDLSISVSAEEVRPGTKERRREGGGTSAECRGRRRRGRRRGGREEMNK